MGHHPKANILAVRAALDELTVARDGVDGKKILLYGEGWNFGEVADDARFVQATQANMAGTGIGTFNDRLRDAVRGGGPFDGDPRIQGFASGLYTDPNGDPVNGTAGRAEGPAAALPGPDQGRADRQPAPATGSPTPPATRGHRRAGRLQRLARPATPPRRARRSPTSTRTTTRSCTTRWRTSCRRAPRPRTGPGCRCWRWRPRCSGRAPGFVTAGSDRLRSKSLDRNSFNSGDWFNQIRWDCAQGNGFGAGLPPAPDNEDKWSYAKPLLADPALVPDCAAIDLAAARYAELLRIRGVVAGVRAGHRRRRCSSGWPSRCPARRRPRACSP